MDEAPQAIDPDGDVVLVLQKPNDPYPWRTPAEEAGGVSIRLRVSSKHLALASPYFHRMFKGDWKEGNSLRSDGHVSVNVEGWDSEALLIVMNIIHGRTRQVPRQVPLQMLGKIAVIVDYYECFEAVEVFTVMWIRQLSSTAGYPTVYNADARIWILVSWVFRQTAPFESTTKTVIGHVAETFDAKGLPIPQAVVAAINDRRTEIISSLINNMKTLLLDLIENRKSTCSSECSYAAVGAFTKGLHQRKLLCLFSSSVFSFQPIPWPILPFVGFSAAGIIDTLRNVHSPKLSSCVHTQSMFGLYTKWHRCDVAQLIHPILDENVIQIRGLNLGECNESKNTPSFGIPTRLSTNVNGGIFSKAS